MQGYSRLVVNFVCGASVFCLMLLIGGCSGGKVLSEEEIEQMADISERIDICVQRLEKLFQYSEHLVNCESQLRQMDATLQRLVGNLSPIQPHDEAVKQIINISKEIALLKDIPINNNTVNQLSNTFEGVLSGMPPLAQESMLQELTAIQWALNALSTQEEVEQEAGLSISILLTLQDLLEVRPMNSPDWLVDRLQVKLNSGTKAWITDLVAKGTKSLEQILDIEAALASLEIEKDDRNQLLVLLLNLKTEAMQQMQNPILKQSAAQDVYDSAVALREVLASQPENSDTTIFAVEVVIGKCEDVIVETVHLRQKEEARKKREYQGWVLKQLDDFSRDSFTSALKDIQSTFSSFENAETQQHWRLVEEYPAFKSALEEIAGQTLRAGNTLSPEIQRAIYGQVWGRVVWKHDRELARIVTREAMVKYLLPVEDRYLEPVIGRLFGKVYNEALTQLEGTDDYLYVAKRTVDVEKILPADL